MRTLGIAVLLAVWSVAAGAQLSSGNLVVSVIKNDSGVPPNSTAQRRILREFSPAGTPTGQEFHLPTTTSGIHARLTNSKTINVPTEGAVSLSIDGRYLLVSGYDAALGTANVYHTTSATVPRVIGRIEWRISEAAGAIDTSTRLNAAFNQETVRAVASLDGTAYYVAGGDTTTGGIHYVTLGSSGASVALQTAARDMRGVLIRDGNLYASCGSPNLHGIGKLGEGLPTTAPQTFSLLPGFTDDTNRPHDFYFADNETLYVADDRTNNSSTPIGGLQKWVYDSVLTQQWRKATTFRIIHAVNQGSSVGAYGVTGTRNSFGNPVLYVISTDSRLLKLTDTGDNSAFEELAVAPQEEIWRGVELLPTSNNGGSTATISGVITLQGCASAAVPLTFQFRMAQGGLFTQTVTPAANGTFTTQPLPRSAGQFGVRASNTLQEIRTFNLSVGNMQSVQIELLAGDANGDNYVDISDLLLLIAHYNHAASDAEYFAPADFNRDGFNDISDLLLLIANYNRSGSFLP